MTMIKRTLTIATLAVLGVWLTGCNKTEEPVTQEGNPTTANTNAAPMTVGIVFDSGGRGDKSFNDSAWAGIERAKKDFGITDKPVESKDVKDYEQNLNALAEQKCDLVIAVGLGMMDAVSKVAKEFPNVKFAIVDAEVTEPNVRCLKFKEEEGSFLAGYLAGLMTKTKKLGFIGGKELDLIKKFEVGFMAGAKTADPTIIIDSKYTGSWDNTDTAKAIATSLYNGGADIIYHAAGRAGLGLFAAAKDQGKFAIGVDSDQDYLEQGVILTSMIKRVDEAVYQTVKDLKDGKWASGVTIYDLTAGGVGLSPMTYTKDKVGAENLKKIEAQSERIKKKEITVPATTAEYDQFMKSLSTPTTTAQ